MTTPGGEAEACKDKSESTESTAVSVRRIHFNWNALRCCNIRKQMYLVLLLELRNAMRMTFQNFRDYWDHAEHKAMFLITPQDEDIHLIEQLFEVCQ